MRFLTTAVVVVSLTVVEVACVSSTERPVPNEVVAGIDSLNARLVEAYRSRNSQQYGELFTDSAVFEWPAFNTVQGRQALEAMVSSNWASLSDQDLRLIVASRRVAPSHATEFGAFQQAYSDPMGARMTEFGRYVVYLARQEDGTWLIDRFFGFSDSTRPAPARP